MELLCEQNFEQEGASCDYICGKVLQRVKGPVQRPWGVNLPGVFRNPGKVWNR